MDVLDLFIRCAIEGCGWRVFPGSEQPDTRCQDHSGNPLAAFRDSEFGTTEWYRRSEFDANDQLIAK